MNHLPAPTRPPQPNAAVAPGILSLLLRLLSLLLLLPGCGENTPAPQPPAAQAPTNRVRLPASARANLGIRFSAAEQRRIAPTVQLPGRYELSAAASRIYPAQLAGTVELNVHLHQRVQRGELLATLRSRQLLELKHELHEAMYIRRRASERLGAAQAELAGARAQLRFAQQRVDRLRSAGVRKAPLEAQLLGARSRIPPLQVAVSAARAEAARNRHKEQVLLRELSVVTGKTVQALLARAPSAAEPGDGAPLWDRLTSVELRARSPGIVTQIGASPGGWVELGAAIVTVTDQRALRFVAQALPADLDAIQGATSAQLHRGASGHAGVPAAISVGVMTDPGRHTVPVHASPSARPTWAAAGATGVLDVALAARASREIAVPAAAIAEDGLQRVVFVRDRKDPDVVIRVPVELGPSDGRWTAVLHGVNEGDEVVVDGVYELVLAASQAPTVKGHFHADGSFHAAEAH